MRSLWMFAPWVRHVYLLTNGQLPSWLQLDNDRLTIVQHSDVFPNSSHLPTFSSPAIESHLHRIAGLSEHFLYFNDDILLGRPIWPEDFYSPVSGYKFRLAWEVPGCSTHCKHKWLGDGICDAECNTALCHFDGGDCGSLSDQADTSASWNRDKRFCSDGCAIKRLGDGRCDAPCDVAGCAFDVGDCGVDHFSQHMPQVVPLLTTAPGQTSYVSVPHDAHSLYINISLLRQTANLMFVGGVYSTVGPPVPGVWATSASRLIAVLLPSTTIASSTFTSHGQLNPSSAVRNRPIESAKSVAEPLDKSPGTVSHTAPPRDPSGAAPCGSTWGVHPAMSLSATVTPTPSSDYPLVSCAVELTLSLAARNSSRSWMTAERRSLHICIQRVDATNTQPDHSHSRLPASNCPRVSTDVERGSVRRDGTDKRFAGVGRGGNATSMVSATDPSTGSSFGLTEGSTDAYGASLGYVDALLTMTHGSQYRRVPAHAPLFMQRSVINELQQRWAPLFERTSSHRFRHGEDMQLAFTYAYHVMYQTTDPHWQRLSRDTWDADGSGWLDRQELHQLLDTVNWEGEQYTVIETLAIQSEQMGKAGLIDVEVLLNNTQTAALLRQRYAQSKYSYSKLDDRDTRFVSVTNNASLFGVQAALIQQSHNKPKFLCLNDDMEDSSDNTSAPTPAALGSSRESAEAVLAFYRSYFPHPSPFELAPGEVSASVNLEHWRRSRSASTRRVSAAIMTTFAAAAALALLVLLARRHLCTGRQTWRYFMARSQATAVDQEWMKKRAKGGVHYCVD